MDVGSPSIQKEQKKRFETAELEILRLGDSLITRLQLLTKLFQIYGSKNVPLHNFIQQCIRIINHLVEEEKRLSLRIIDDDFSLNGQRLRYSVRGFASYKNLHRQWQKKLIGGVVIKEPINDTILREFIYGFLALEEGKKENPDLFTSQLAEKGITSIEIDPFEVVEDGGKKRREGEGEPGEKHEDSVSFLNDPKVAAKKVFFEAVAGIRGFMKSVGVEEYPNLRRLKRVAQKAVHLVLEDESYLLGLASIKNYDEYTFNHSVNVAIYALAIGNRLGFSKNTLKELGLTALLHDIGKSKIPKKILNKPGPLDKEEWEVMKGHPLEGVEIVLNLRQMGEIYPKMVFGIFEHHQKDNFMGYPELLLKTERNFFGQIIQIADVYDALVTPRVYKKAFSPEEALSIMLKDKGTQFDIILLKIFIGLVGIYPVGSLVQLNTQELGVICKSNPRCVDRPSVLLLDSDKARYPKKEMIDLTETDSQGQYKRSIVKTLDPLKYRIDIGKYFI